MITLIPLREAKPGLPLVTGMTRTTLPSCCNVRVCFLTSTVLIMDGPTLKRVFCARELPQTPGASSTADRRADTSTLVSAGQYTRGRHCTCLEESQRQSPSIPS